MVKMMVDKTDILNLLAHVNDPEIPVLSILDLGIVRDVIIRDDQVSVIITPTYSGCPALETIQTNIEEELKKHGYRNVSVQATLSPAWTTDWMTDSGKEKLKAFGIAPPNPSRQICDIGL